MRRYLLTDEAKQDLIGIRRYLRDEAGNAVALYVARKLTAAFVFLASAPGAGHEREDLTPEAIKFWPVFSYLVVYDPVPRPIHILRVLHGKRDVATVLQNRN